MVLMVMSWLSMLSRLVCLCVLRKWCSVMCVILWLRSVVSMLLFKLRLSMLCVMKICLVGSVKVLGIGMLMMVKVNG